MKKITAIIMCIFCAFALVSCNNPNVDTNYDYDYIIDGVGYEEYSEYCVVIGFTDDIGKSVTIQEEINDKPVTSINESAFNGCSLTSITIPDSVTSIDNYAFSGCNGLTSINIPNSVISIGTLAFGDCSSLASITVENDNAIYDSRDNCNAIIETDSDTLVVGCKSTIIPDSVTSIGNYAFKGCSSLALIKIPDSVTWIGDSAFEHCNSLKEVYYSGSNEQWSNISIGYSNDFLLSAMIHFNSEI